jgi:hypothetical protein
MEASAMMSDVNELEDLVGCELGTVAFVRNYVEFIFDGPVLRSLTPPVVIVDGLRHEFPQPGSRDVLCELIGRVVEGAGELPDRLSVSFAGGSVVEIPRSGKDAVFEVAELIPVIGGKLHVASMIVWENLYSARVDISDVEFSG